ncbi:GPW/gp25 family protein [Mastigocoleus testarum]|uniref:Baseplate protein n=1 Tax=Mastigocoleus testarum BC008 TaxID=371196 RepID=A0A0V7ZJP0_9CYAN|nr:GPW/gp25 family protein [Mastigocoleus testarum]KST62196.1 baseplate protein [Mastigocoleus testarum BC008]KST64826.1 baseplate protein [Mastigocoleus testarum BC008]
MAKEFLGIGWKFPVKVDNSTGKILISEYEENIRESIWIILATSKGERAMQPDFGCEIHNFIFATLSMTTLGLVESSVREALIRWEPRIDLNEIKVIPIPKTPGNLKININYRVRKTNNAFNLVYPFYLQGG